MVNEWLNIGQSNRSIIGPEIGIVHYIRQATNEPVLLLKSCIGNRALGWDLLPPGSEEYEFTDSEGVVWVNPGHGGSPERWQKGTDPEKSTTWYAGIQYDGDIARAKQVLSELDTYYPDAEKYEIAGFFWWQGDRDRLSEAHSMRYEKNLVQLIKKLRKDFNAPGAKLVSASLGQTRKDDEGNERLILDAMFAVDSRSSSRYPEFNGNVATVYSHPLSKGTSSSNHYYGHAETYMNIGEAMGCAMMMMMMMELLLNNNTPKCSKLLGYNYNNASEPPSSSPSPSLKLTYVPTIVVGGVSPSFQPSSNTTSERPEPE